MFDELPRIVVEVQIVKGSGELSEKKIKFQAFLRRVGKVSFEITLMNDECIRAAAFFRSNNSFQNCFI